MLEENTVSKIEYEAIVKKLEVRKTSAVLSEH